VTRRPRTTILAGALVVGLSACGSTPGNPTGTGGSGAGGHGGAAGAAGRGGSGGQAGVAGAGGVSGSGGSGGQAGAAGAGGVAGSGGSSGQAGAAGAGGVAGSGGSGGQAGAAGTGGVVGRGGSGGQAGAAGAGGVAGSGGASGTGGAAGPSLSVHELDVHGQRMIYDASRARLYVSAGAQATANANTIEIVDAIGETIVSTISIGNDPGPLALSDDATTLWVGLTGDNAIRSVDLTTTPPTVNPEHPVPKPSTVSTAQARTLVVLPGTRNTVVASVSSVIYVFDDGVARANHAGGNADRVAIGPPGYVFGENTQTTGYDFTSFAITDAGAQMVADVQGLMQSNVDDIVYWYSRVYGYWGEATDVSDPTKPKRAGKFDFQGAITGRDATHLLMMSWSSLLGADTPQAIRVLDTTTFTQTASMTVPTTLLTNATFMLDLCYLGGDRAAFLTLDYSSANRLFFIETPVIAQ